MNIETNIREQKLKNKDELGNILIMKGPPLSNKNKNDN